MDKKQKFEKFLESLKGNDQDILIENVKKGFRICFESVGDNKIDWNMLRSGHIYGNTENGKWEISTNLMEDGKILAFKEIGGVAKVVKVFPINEYSDDDIKAYADEIYEPKDLDSLDRRLG